MRAGVVAAQAAAGRERGRAASLFAEHLDHAARRVAVERRERAAQHLDAIGRAELDVGDLALAVGQGRRDAVDIQAHAADAEGRARAEAADRELHVLGVVLPVARQQAGHAAQAFRDVDLRLAFADRLAADAVDRCRHVERRDLGAGGGDDHRRQPDRGLAAGALRQRGGGQRHRPEGRAGTGPAGGAHEGTRGGALLRHGGRLVIAQPAPGAGRQRIDPDPAEVAATRATRPGCRRPRPCA